MFLPGVAARSEFTSAAASHVPLWKNMSVAVAWLVLVTEHLTHAILLNPPSLSCLMLRVKLATA